MCYKNLYNKSNPDITSVTISLMIDTIAYEDLYEYSLASQNRRTSESRIKLTCIMPSEEEEEEGKCLSRLVQTSETQSVL